VPVKVSISEVWPPTKESKPERPSVNFVDPEAEAERIFWSPVSSRIANALPVTVPEPRNPPGRLRKLPLVAFNAVLPIVITSAVVPPVPILIVSAPVPVPILIARVKAPPAPIFKVVAAVVPRLRVVALVLPKATVPEAPESIVAVPDPFAKREIPALLPVVWSVTADALPRLKVVLSALKIPVPLKVVVAEPLPKERALAVVVPKVSVPAAKVSIPCEVATEIVPLLSILNFVAPEAEAVKISCASVWLKMATAWPLVNEPAREILAELVAVAPRLTSAVREKGESAPLFNCQ